MTIWEEKYSKKCMDQDDCERCPYSKECANATLTDLINEIISKRALTGEDSLNQEYEI